MSLDAVSEPFQQIADIIMRVEFAIIQLWIIVNLNTGYKRQGIVIVLMAKTYLLADVGQVRLILVDRVCNLVM